MYYNGESLKSGHCTRVYWDYIDPVLLVIWLAWTYLISMVYRVSQTDCHEAYLLLFRNDCDDDLSVIIGVHPFLLNLLYETYINDYRFPVAYCLRFEGVWILKCLCYNRQRLLFSPVWWYSGVHVRLLVRKLPAKAYKCVSGETQKESNGFL